MSFRLVISSSKAITARGRALSFCSPAKTHLNFPFPATTHKTHSLTLVPPFVRMASGDQQFPKQKQETQPGKEHVMDPNPQYTSKDYKPSNKLQVFNLFVNYILIKLFIYLSCTHQFICDIFYFLGGGSRERLHW